MISTVENGASVNDQKSQLSTIFILDCSRSMGESLDRASRSSKLDLSKSALIAALSRAIEGNSPDQVGVITVSTDIFAKPLIKEALKLSRIFDPQTSKRSLWPIDGITSLKAQGGTTLFPAISYAIELLFADVRQKNNLQQIVVMTDSKSKTSDRSMRALAEASKNQIRIHVIDLGNPKDQENLRMICDATGGEFKLVTNPNELETCLSSFFTFPPKENPESSRGPILTSKILSEVTKPSITPKRKHAETTEEIQQSIGEIKNELETLTQSLKSGSITQIKFSERYSILQFELQELRQLIREARSKLNREMAEFALARGKSAEDSSLNRETNEKLVELDKQIQILRQSANFVS